MKASLSFALTCCSLVLLNSTAFSAPVTGDTTNNVPSTWSFTFTSPTGDTTNNPPSIWSFTSPTGDTTNYSPSTWSFTSPTGDTTNNPPSTWPSTSMTPTGATTSKPPSTLPFTFTSPEPSQQSSTATETPHQRILLQNRESKARRKVGNYTTLHLPKLVGQSTTEHNRLRDRLRKKIENAVRLCREDGESEKDCRKRLRKEVYSKLKDGTTAADSDRIATETLNDMKRRKLNSGLHGGTSELPAPLTLHGFEERQHGKGNSVSDTLLPPKTHMNVNSDSLVGTSTRCAPVIIDLAQELDSLNILVDSVDSKKRRKLNSDRHGGTSDSTYIDFAWPFHDSEAPFLLDSFVQRPHGKGDPVTDTLLAAISISALPAPVVTDVIEDCESLKYLKTLWTHL